MQCNFNFDCMEDMHRLSTTLIAKVLTSTQLYASTCMFLHRSQVCHGSCYLAALRRLITSCTSSGCQTQQGRQAGCSIIVKAGKQNCSIISVARGPTMSLPAAALLNATTADAGVPAAGETLCHVVAGGRLLLVLNCIRAAAHTAMPDSW